jgi:aminopeptidase N
MRLSLILSFLVFVAKLTFAGGLPFHDLSVKIVPSAHYLIASDRITLPVAQKEVRFFINKNLSIKDIKPDGLMEIKEEGNQKRIDLSFPEPQSSFTVRYEGIIYEPVEQIGEQARGYSYTGGIISEEGVFLHGGSFWYPAMENGLLRFRLSIELPEGWYGISQGNEERGDKLIIWNSPEPQEEIYLVANRFVKYEEEIDGFRALVLLRSPDEELARKYISATFRYIRLYEDLIGPYPYRKFALVENFFESGFGMPSFTLLGPKVLRLPFIIDSSYPHEILHNWWGNSVWPGHGKGNWTEGLTAYLSDHLIKELKGEDREYRFTVLQKYADYVLNEREISIEEFRERHSASQEAIGYGKSLYLFHMLRRDLGDKVFIEGLREFYRSRQFRYADMDDIRESFEKVSGKDLKGFFNQWAKRRGAPLLKIKGHRVKERLLSITIEQAQEGPSYSLKIPLTALLEDGSIFEAQLEIDKREKTFEIELPRKPLRVDIDPEYDIFRRLLKEEIPPAITGVLGSKEVVVIKESDTPKDYNELIDMLKKAGPEEVMIMDDRVSSLPEKTVILLGWNNRFLKNLKGSYGVSIRNGIIEVSGRVINPERESLVFVISNPESPERPLMFIGSENPHTLKALSRKLPHYHKYSYLVFEGDEAINTMKGRWEIKDSPLSIVLQRNAKPEIKRKTLVPDFSKERLIKTIKFLTSEDLKGRKAGSEEALKVAGFIKEAFKEAGLEPYYENDYLEQWKEKELSLANIAGRLKGPSDACIVIGAHYDHLGMDAKGNIYPGADDNASGIALLIELARIMAEIPHKRELIFVAFSGEELGRLGSRYFLRNMDLKRCIAMINLDTVGRLFNKRLIIIGTPSAKEWPLILKEASIISGIEIDIAKEDLDSSDQKSFEESGIPAIQLFSGPHEDYHRPSDTMDRLDMEGLIRIGRFTKELLRRLDHSSGLSFTGSVEKGPLRTERKVGLGTIPDFTYKGRGYRIAGVIKNSPADQAGLKEGDVIIEISSRPINSLKELSEYLKTLKPGQRVNVKIQRNGEEIVFDLEVRELR